MTKRTTYPHGRAPLTAIASGTSLGTLNIPVDADSGMERN